ncbi:RHO1 GDP-GTP exchange protein 2, partial [Cladochytrium tenue]
MRMMPQCVPSLGGLDSFVGFRSAVLVARAAAQGGDRSNSRSGRTDGGIREAPMKHARDRGAVSSDGGGMASTTTSSTTPGAAADHAATPAAALDSLANLFPAFLSHIAAAFLAQVPLGTLVKDSIDYQDCFLGSEAVDTLAYLIQTSDRNVSLILGRALEAQGFIYNVTYSSQLCDSSTEIFKINPYAAFAILDPFGVSAGAPEREHLEESERFENSSDWTDATKLAYSALPQGVFTILTDCYSPTCTNGHMCYSVSCPRRLEQDDWWSNTVPPEVLASVSKEEEKRQNAIYDLIKTERNYVEELKTIQTLYAIPLQASDVIEESRKASFMKRVFLNSQDLLAANSLLLQRLLQRQRENRIIELIGDIFLEATADFRVYIEYCGNREYSRNEIAYEKAQNARFKEFLSDINLGSPDRRYLYEGKLLMKKLSGGEVLLNVFLFDHVLVLTKDRPEKRPENDTQGRAYRYLVYKMPMPLELLLMDSDPGFNSFQKYTQPMETATDKIGGTLISASASVAGGASVGTAGNSPAGAALGPQLITFLAETESARNVWRDQLQRARDRRAEQLARVSKHRFVQNTRQSLPHPHGRVFCAALAGGRLFVGTDQGIFVCRFTGVNSRTSVAPNPAASDFRSNPTALEFHLLPGAPGAHEMVVLSKFELIVFLHDKTLYTMPMEVAEEVNAGAAAVDGTARRVRKVQENVTLIKAGVCGERTIVCALTSAALSSTIRVFEPQAVLSTKR